jgi:hypothetical protein
VLEILEAFYAARERFSVYLRRRFMARWMLANVVGWSLGLYLGSALLQWLGGVVGLGIGGAAAGTFVGAAQHWALRGKIEVDRRWIGYSAAAGAGAALPVLALGFTLLIPTVGLSLLGGIAGGLIGAAQGVVLRERLGSAGLWLLANAAGGVFCAVCSLSGIPFWLPIFCTAGPYLFAAITGWALLRLLREAQT